MMFLYWTLVSMLMPLMGGIITIHIYHENFTLIFWIDLILFIANAIVVGACLTKTEKEKK